MHPVEIITIIAIILVVGTFFGVYIYKKVKKKPTGECASCHSKSKKMVKMYKKKYKKKDK
ncbi:MAG TPA: hypothetical protein VJY64_02575 [Candidatus Onthovivens sp.]|nr:hypothetical protein [Candidatus Onthovivens sp.]